jgi:hypothetical protein
MVSNPVGEERNPERLRKLGDVDEVADQRMELLMVGFGPEKRMAWLLIHVSTPPEPGTAAGSGKRDAASAGEDRWRNGDDAGAGWSTTIVPRVGHILQMPGTVEIPN